MFLDKPPEAILWLSRDIFKDLICCAKKIVRTFAHGVDFSSSIGDGTAHLQCQLMRELVFVCREYIQRLSNNRFTLIKSELFERWKGISCRTSSLENLVDRAAGMFEDDIARGGRDSADLVRHLQQCFTNVLQLRGRKLRPLLQNVVVMRRAFTDVWSYSEGGGKTTQRALGGWTGS